MCFETECIIAPQGHPRSFDFGTNRKRVCDFLLVINSNICPILPRFRDIALCRFSAAAKCEYYAHGTSMLRTDGKLSVAIPCFALYVHRAVKMVGKRSSLSM